MNEERYNQFKEKLGFFDWNQSIYGLVKFTEIVDKLEGQRSSRGVSISLYNDAIIRYEKQIFNNIENWETSENRVEPIYFVYEFEGFTRSFYGKENGWYELKIISAERKENYAEDEEFIFGKVFFAASPVKWQSVKVKLIKQAPMVISKIDYRKQIEIEKKKGSVILGHGKYFCGYPYGSSSIATLYNIGQANSTHIQFNKYVSAFIDIGYPTCGCDSELKKSNLIYKRKISKKNADFVFLTHWCLDHFLGVCEHEHFRNNVKRNRARSLYDAYWLAPDPTNNPDASDASLRLCLYLLQRKKICLIDTKTNPRDHVIGSSCLDIYSGEYSGDIRNDFGLIYEIKGKNTNFLFPGDASYRVFPKEIVGRDFKYILAPHHCSGMIPPNIRGIKSKNLLKFHNNQKCGFTFDNSIAFITAGKTNTHGHPDPKHMADLKRQNFELFILSSHCAESFEIIID
ncbi:MAG: hypothetical protein FWE22_01895 [Firmicutes bacterium]|nr:hypothetical protein [Bacillota bacterium]